MSEPSVSPRIALTVRIDGRKITTWPDFHQEFARAFDFPPYYGKNLDAWIDCMSHLDLDEGQSRQQVRAGEFVLLELENAKFLRAEKPDIHAAILECCSFVNGSRIEVGEPPIIIVSEYLGGA